MIKEKKDKFLEEKQHLIEMLKYIECENYNIIKPQTDPPDLIVNISNDLYGVEHTRFFNNKKKSQLNEWSQLITNCENNLKEKGYINYVIRLNPNHKEKLSKRRRLIIENEIIKIIEEKIYNVEFEKNTISQNPFPELQSIKAFKSKGKFVITFDSYKYESNSLSSEIIVNEIIKSKTEKLSKIKTDTFKQLWLLIVIEGNLSSDSPELKKNKIVKEEHNFDKIYFMHLKNKWLKELKMVNS